MSGLVRARFDIRGSTMCRRWLTSGRLVALLALACAVPVGESSAEPKDGDRSSLYFPTRAGARWVYQVTTAGSTTEVTEVVTRVEEKDGRFRIFVGREADGKVSPLLTAEVSRAGVAWLSAGEQAYRSPSRQLKLPVKAGDTWEWRSDGPAQQSAKMSYRTVGEEDVEVPAGTYRAVRVEAKSEFGGKPVVTMDWYAPSVGRVKSVAKVGDRETTIVLKKFTAGRE